MEDNSNLNNEGNNNYPEDKNHLNYTNENNETNQQGNSYNANQQNNEQAAYQNNNFHQNQNYYDVPPNQLPPIQNYYEQKLVEPMSLKDWIITELLLLIPIVNFILLIVWACDGSTNVNKRNFSKAKLILMLISIGISVAVVILCFVFGLYMARDLYYYY